MYGAVTNAAAAVTLPRHISTHQIIRNRRNSNKTKNGAPHIATQNQDSLKRDQPRFM